MSCRAALDQAQRLLRWGRFEGAAAAFRAAAAELVGDGDRALALLGAARALSALGDPRAATDACRSAIRLQPRDPAAHGLLAVLLANIGDLDSAAQAAEVALAIDPVSVPLLDLCASIALRRGLREAAVQFCDVALASMPTDQRALSLLALASEQPNRLLDLQSQVLLETLAAPSGFADLEAFNAALSATILAHPDLGASPPGGPLALAQRLPNLRSLPAVLVSPLEAALRAGAARLAARLQRSAFLAGPVSLRGWVNVMSALSHEAPHIHEGGCMSGVYYVAMPTQGGEIAFGGHDLGAEVPAGPTRTLRPRPGDLLIFPSHLYHSVPPFNGDGRRISIAVDLVADGPGLRPASPGPARQD